MSVRVIILDLEQLVVYLSKTEKSKEDFPRGIGLKISETVGPSIEDSRTWSFVNIRANR